MTIIDDLKWAARLARRRPLSTAAAAATLAVSIAAATTAFGLATAVLWRPLPFGDEARLVLVWESVDDDGQPSAARVTSGRYVEWREQSRSLSSMAAFGAAGFTADGPDGATSLRGLRVSAAYFDVLGLTPILGRTFTPADEMPGQHQVVVLSHALWRQQYGGDPGVLGANLRLSGTPYTVIGVMPDVVSPGWPANPAVVNLAPDVRQFWVPIAATPAFAQQMRAHLFGVVARLGPGVSIEQAAAELTSVVAPDAPDPHGAALVPIRNQFVRDARLPLLALLGAALAVLFIACTNLAALHATALESRRVELAMRAAIGAGRWRLVQQLATESIVLALVGGAGGIWLSSFALAAVPGLLPHTMPMLTQSALDWRVAWFGLVTTVGAGVVMSAWPIARLTGATLAPRGVSAGPRSLVFRGLVVSQIAITGALVACAGLLAQSLSGIRGQDPGFVIDGVLVAEVGLPAVVSQDPVAIAGLEARVLQAMAARPGVTGIAFAYDHPLEANWIDAYTLVGDTASGSSDIRDQAELRIVSPGYFDALGVDVLDGRGFGPNDDLSAPGAVLVNEALARGLPPGLVLGRRLRSAAASYTWGERAPQEYQIVGVVENERFRGAEEPPQPALYVSTLQFPQSSAALLVRTVGDPLAVAPDVRATIRAIVPGATIAAPASLAAIQAEQLVVRRVTTDVIGGFAGAALLLASLGLYGLMAAAVASRRREIGVRLALGATPSLVARQVVGESLANVVLGIAGALVLGLAAGRVLESLLFGVSARDPLTLGAVGGTLVTVAFLAALGPASRAAAVDPALMLRGE